MFRLLQQTCIEALMEDDYLKRDDNDATVYCYVPAPDVQTQY